VVDTFARGVAWARPTLDSIRKAVEALPPPRRPRWGCATWPSAARLVDDLLRVAGQVGTLNIGLSSAAREHEAFFSWTTTGLGVWLHSKDFELLRTVVTFDAWMEREEAALVRR